MRVRLPTCCAPTPKISIVVGYFSPFTVVGDFWHWGLVCISNTSSQYFSPLELCLLILLYSAPFADALSCGTSCFFFSPVRQCKFASIHGWGPQLFVALYVIVRNDWGFGKSALAARPCSVNFNQALSATEFPDSRRYGCGGSMP